MSSIKISNLKNTSEEIKHQINYQLNSVGSYFPLSGANIMQYGYVSDQQQQVVNLNENDYTKYMFRFEQGQDNPWEIINGGSFDLNESAKIAALTTLMYHIEKLAKIEEKVENTPKPKTEEPQRRAKTGMVYTLGGPRL